MTTYNPSVDTTIFPRVNFYKNFTGRAVRRDLNGRIYGKYGDVPIDAINRYPAVEGSLEFAELLPFPVDLGPDVATVPTQVIDLRNPETPIGFSGYVVFNNTYDLNPLIPPINDDFYYPPETGAVEFSVALPFPVDLGPDVATTPTRVIDARVGDDNYELNPLIPPIDDSFYYPVVSGAKPFSDALPFPVELGPDVATTTTDKLDLRSDDASYDLN